MTSINVVFCLLKSLIDNNIYFYSYIKLKKRKTLTLSNFNYEMFNI